MIGNPILSPLRHDDERILPGSPHRMPAGRPQMHLLGAIAEFERARIAERVKAGLQRARAHGGRLGRPQAFIPVERVFRR